MATALEQKLEVCLLRTAVPFLLAGGAVTALQNGSRHQVHEHGPINALQG